MSDLRPFVLEILKSQDFLDVYQKHLFDLVKHKGQEAGYDLLQGYIEKIETPECYIAVLGIQGAGKSSLLNALLFQDEILPVAVEETTCIPTLIRRMYTDETVGAEIHFGDGRVEQIPLERQFLEKVVDNRYNPGNLMDVSFVLCRTDSSLLQEGFVFVDLPGVGSLTPKNEQTTLRFLQKTHIGIFLLRTVPPITESESGFIKVAWPRLQKSIFVQNLWARETEREVKEGMVHNEIVLTQIAESQHTQKPQKIVPINVAMACQASFSQDMSSMQESGLVQLEESIRQYAQTASLQLLYQDTCQFFLRLCQKAQSQLQNRLQLLDGNLQKLSLQLDTAQKTLAENQSRLEIETQRCCDDFMARMNTIKNAWLPQHLDVTLESVIYRLDKMPIEDMTEAQFRQEVREAFSQFFSAAYREFKQKLGQNAEEYVHHLGQSISKLSGWEKIFSANWQADSANTEKSASGLSVALAGSIAPLLVAGPVGWSILGGALLTGSLVRWVSGATLHQRILRGLRKTLGDSKNKIWQDLCQEVLKFSEIVRQNIAENLQRELQSYQIELDKVREDITQAEKLQQSPKNSIESELQLMQTFVEKWQKLVTQNV